MFSPFRNGRGQLQKTAGKGCASRKRNKKQKTYCTFGTKNLEFQKLNSGKIADVLFEKDKNSGMITGFTGNYIRVEYPWQAKLAGQIRKVNLKGISPSGKMDIELIDNYGQL